MLREIGVIIILVLMLLSCASTNKAKLFHDNPKAAIGELEMLKKYATNDQVDLLANDQFEDGTEKLNSAKKSYKNDGDKKNIMNTLSESKAYFIEARTVAESKPIVPKRVLAARKEALNNNVRSNQELSEKMKEIDDSIISETNNFKKGLEVDQISLFEKKYLRLEIDSMQNIELVKSRMIIKRSLEENAIEFAPITYRNAYNDLKAAENMIQQNPRNPENYETNVMAANKSSKLLSDVMKKLNGVAKGASEEAALALVFQERKLGILSSRTSSLQGALIRSQSHLDHVENELKYETGEAMRSRDKVRMQSAMDNVRKKFTKDEAAVYQQGGNIIIRLKQIDFKSGSAMVPGDSMKLLAKVNDAVGELASSRVIVQGHTDSTGRRINNQTLSVNRSKAVANYLNSLENSYDVSSSGFGESRPIASNQTSSGRAINRRVDIVVSTNKNL